MRGAEERDRAAVQVMATRIQKAIRLDHIPEKRWGVIVKRFVLGASCCVFAWLWRETLGVWPTIGVGAFGLLLIDPELVTSSAMAAVKPLREYKKLSGKDGSDA